MRVFLRCDIGGAAGLGHAQRMLSLAYALEDLGITKVTFLTQTASLRDFVDPFETFTPQVQARANEEALLFEGMALAHDPVVFVLDHAAYYPAPLLQRIRKAGAGVVRIDHPHATAGTADLVVLPGAHYSETILAQVSDELGTALLHGTDYVVLSQEGKRRTRYPYTLYDPPWSRKPQIVFSAGGSDPHDRLTTMLSATQDLHAMIPDVDMLFMVGAYRRDPYRVSSLHPRAFLAGFDLRYVQDAMLCVMPLGLTVYEAMYLGTPALTLRYPNHGAYSDHALACKVGASVAYGQEENAEIVRSTFCESLYELWKDDARRRSLADKSEGVIDGEGAHRIARAMLAHFNL